VRAFRRLSLATTIATIGVIAIGGFVRASGSGDGCPDWPKCFGRWFPPLDFHAIVEYSHRYAGAIAILLATSTAILAWRRHRTDRRISLASLLIVPGMLMQAGLGGYVVWIKEEGKLDPSIARLEGPVVTFHIATAMLLIGLIVLLTLRAFRLDGRIASTDADAKTRRLGWLAAGGVYALILVGAYVRGTDGAGLAFPDWPLMDGTLLPDLSGTKGLHFAHRVVALIVGILVAWFAVRVTRMKPRSKALLMFAHAAAGLYVVQAIVGGLQVITRLDAVPVGFHVLLSGMIWSSLVASTALMRPLAAYGAPLRSVRLTVREPEPVPIAGGQVDVAIAGPASTPILARIGAYIALTKPRIIILLLITTLPAMILAAGGWPGTALAAWTILGGTLGAGAANAINMVIDRDIDAIMQRTRRRPLPLHSVTPERALTFAMGLAATSFVLMVQTTNLLAALLVQSAIAFYVFIYTLALKRSTPQNIVIGGAAGAVPVLVGWAAVTGTVSLEAWLLFAIIFAWTPPHFWALAIRYRKDYEAAGVPMLPVVAGGARTQRSILAYTIITLALSAGLGAVAGLGWIYASAAIVLGAWFLRDAIRLARAEQVTSKIAMTVFKTSISYLGALFLAVGIDVLA